MGRLDLAGGIAGLTLETSTGGYGRGWGTTANNGKGGTRRSRRGSRNGREEQRIQVGVAR
jgi:hypothetical protein